MKSTQQDSDQVYYLRPKTRGELVNELDKGLSCEVLASNATSTKMLIDAWLNPPEYIIIPSENYGWVIFEPGKYLVK